MARLPSEPTVKEKVGFDVYGGYVFSSEGIVSYESTPSSWQGALDFYATGINQGGHALISRIGLVLACSDRKFLQALLTCASVHLDIDQKNYASFTLAAFQDAAMAQCDDSPSDLAELAFPVFSHSLPIEPAHLPQRCPVDVRVKVPPYLEKRILLEERRVLDYCNKPTLRRPEWFIALGVRLIGTKVRDIL